MSSPIGVARWLMADGVPSLRPPLAGAAEEADEGLLGGCSGLSRFLCEREAVKLLHVSLDLNVHTFIGALPLAAAAFSSPEASEPALICRLTPRSLTCWQSFFGPRVVRMISASSSFAEVLSVGETMVPNDVGEEGASVPSVRSSVNHSPVGSGKGALRRARVERSVTVFLCFSSDATRMRKSERRGKRERREAKSEGSTKKGPIILSLALVCEG
jgi:hypothetical protein